MKIGISLLVLFLLIGCGIPYPGSRTILPNKTINVVDESNAPITSYDLFLYRCYYPGSKLDRVFSYPSQSSSKFILKEETELGWKRAGWFGVTPDFLVPYEDEPYWVVCINKSGFANRRWGLPSQGNTSVSIVLNKSETVGPDICMIDYGKCTPCKSYEYFSHGNSRYRHKDCE